ncbi:MAG: HAD-IIA family hydrolase [Clostridia bacterium]|nr:HAD-IIA family hydrolase [Clostridia bacterium]
MPQRLTTKRLFLFDMDGTLYLGNRLFDFTPSLLAAIRAKGGRYLFMTNNSSKSVQDYIKKLASLSIDAVYDDFITSSQATAYYLKQHYAGKTLYVCGTRSLIAELEREGFEVTTDLDRVDVLVMGYDTELTFRKLEDASRLLLGRDLPYIATNPDYVCPTEFGSVPDCGSVCDMLFNVSKKRPFVIGKPSPMMPTLAMEMTGFGKEETVVIGDRIYTDVKSGLAAGVTSVLVLSGETTKEILDASDDKPDIVLASAAEILKYI